MKQLALSSLILAGFLAGCTNAGEVSQSDAAKNQQAFSQEAYDQAMIKSGKGKELEEEKRRNEAYLRGGQ